MSCLGAFLLGLNIVRLKIQGNADLSLGLYCCSSLGRHSDSFILVYFILFYPTARTEGILKMR